MSFTVWGYGSCLQCYARAYLISGCFGTALLQMWLHCYIIVSVLAQLLGDLAQFLKLLDQEKLSGNATVQKCLLSDLLQSYTSANGKPAISAARSDPPPPPGVASPAARKPSQSDTLLNRCFQTAELGFRSLPDMTRGRRCCFLSPFFIFLFTSFCF